MFKPYFNKIRSLVIVIVTMVLWVWGGFVKADGTHLGATKSIAMDLVAPTVLEIPWGVEQATSAGLVLADSVAAHTGLPSGRLTHIGTTAVDAGGWVTLDSGVELKSASPAGYLLFRTRASNVQDGDVITVDVVPFTVSSADGRVQQGQLRIQVLPPIERPGPLRAALPDWLTLRLAVPNADVQDRTYASYSAIAGNGDRFVSENLTKTGHTASGSSANTMRVDLSQFLSKAALLDKLHGKPAPFDLHGVVWHNSMATPLRLALRDEPQRAPEIITEILDRHFAAAPFERFDINEVARATREMDAAYGYWRGPVRSLDRGVTQGLGPQGSPWYEAFARAKAQDPDFWRHDPGYWWLAAVAWGNANGHPVVFQDFDFEAGRPWGVGDSVPMGMHGPTGEHLKRRRILDALNYALAQGYIVDTLGFQGHLRPDRAIDTTDLTAFLHSVTAMGVDVEVTELDVQPVSRSAQFLAPVLATPEVTAGYTAHFLDQLFAATAMVNVGAWTNWAPPGLPPRQSVLDRDGSTHVGHALVLAATRAQPPKDRPAGEILRHYQLTHGVTGDLWRAAQARDLPGFELQGNAAGTPVRPGSGGAQLPLTNVHIVPGGPVAPVWHDGSQLRDYDPAAMGLAFQWVNGGHNGTVLSLGDAATGDTHCTLRVVDGRLWADSGTGAPMDIGPVGSGASRVVLNWSADRLAIQLRTQGKPVSELHTLGWRPLGDTGQITLLGDGTVYHGGRATELVLYKDLAGAETLALRTHLRGANFLKPREIARLSEALEPH